MRERVRLDAGILEQTLHHPALAEADWLEWYSKYTKNNFCYAFTTTDMAQAFFAGRASR